MHNAQGFRFSGRVCVCVGLSFAYFVMLLVTGMYVVHMILYTHYTYCEWLALIITFVHCKRTVLQQLIIHIINCKLSLYRFSSGV